MWTPLQVIAAAFSNHKIAALCTISNQVAFCAIARTIAAVFGVGFLFATSRIPTVTSPQSPISSPQPVQVTMLSSVERGGTEIRLLPQWRQRRGVLSIWEGSVTGAPPRPIENRANYTPTYLTLQCAFNGLSAPGTCTNLE